MAQIAKFSNIRLVSTGKSGILPKDQDGYTTVIVGGLNVFNSAGEYYTANGAKELFEKSSSFMRKVTSGALRGEVGHPRKGNLSNEAYIHKLMSIDDTNVCVHFSDIWLDSESVRLKDGKPVIAIMAKIIPSGPKADTVERALNNPKENLSFSVRGITTDYYDRGQTVRELKQIITFDYVNEPGISIAEKYGNPTLESINEFTVSKNEMLKAMDCKLSGVATESSKTIGNDLIKALGWELPKGSTANYIKW